MEKFTCLLGDISFDYLIFPLKILDTEGQIEVLGALDRWYWIHSCVGTWTAWSLEPDALIHGVGSSLITHRETSPRTELTCISNFLLCLCETGSCYVAELTWNLLCRPPGWPLLYRDPRLCLHNPLIPILFLNVHFSLKLKITESFNSLNSKVKLTIV